MCGIVGIFDLRGQRKIDRALLSAMNESQRHRGPDGSGLHLGPGIGLGHRRLAVIDLATGAQPLYNEDRTIAVVYNGEIYNYRDLFPELLACGHRFSSQSDTEAIVHGWEEWGESCVQRFNGMFAFALWDANREVLFLARDRLGEKPLYYAEFPDGTFLFGSELKSLLVHPDMARTLDVRAVADYFAYGYVPDPKTIYAGIKKLPPGHVLSVRRGAPVPTPRPYWDVSFRNQGIRRESDAIDDLLARLRKSVARRMIADVPLGAFLSGGVDSGAVVATMAGISHEPVNTFSIAFGAKDHDESHYARELAERYRTRHHERIVAKDDFDLIDQLAAIYDEPFADSSAMPTYRVCQSARAHVTVALSGDGGDEVFAGYRRYRLHRNEERVRQALPLALRKPLFGFLGSIYPKADWAPRPLRAKTTFQTLGRETAEAYFRGMSLMRAEMRSRLFSSSFTRALQGYDPGEVLARHMNAAPADDPVSQAQYADLKTYLSGDILTKVDRASMANSLEVRVPLLDHEVVEWAASLPATLKLRKSEGKYVFKKAIEPLVPHETLRRPKMGFSVPLAHWFRGPLRERVRSALESPILAETGIFDMAFVGELVRRHQSGVRNHAAPIWALLMFESFLRNVHTDTVRGSSLESPYARAIRLRA